MPVGVCVCVLTRFLYFFMLPSPFRFRWSVRVVPLPGSANPETITFTGGIETSETHSPSHGVSMQEFNMVGEERGKRDMKKGEILKLCLTLTSHTYTHTHRHRQHVITRANVRSSEKGSALLFDRKYISSKLMLCPSGYYRVRLDLDTLHTHTHTYMHTYTQRTAGQI